MWNLVNIDQSWNPWGLKGRSFVQVFKKKNSYFTECCAESRSTQEICCPGLWVCRDILSKEVHRKPTRWAMGLILLWSGVYSRLCALFHASGEKQSPREWSWSYRSLLHLFIHWWKQGGPPRRRCGDTSVAITEKSFCLIQAVVFTKCGPSRNVQRQDRECLLFKNCRPFIWPLRAATTLKQRCVKPSCELHGCTPTLRCWFLHAVPSRLRYSWWHS